MKNTIKTVAYGFLALTTVLTGIAPAFTALAAPTFNTQAGDFSTFRVANANQSVGTFNWASSVSANPGETVAFIVSFHNTSNEVAQDVRIRSTLPSVEFSSATIFGEIVGINFTRVSGSVNVSLTSRQTLTFVPGTTQVFSGLNASPVAIPLGQSGNEVVSESGLRLGNLQPDARGFVVFRAIVGQNVVPPQGQQPSVVTQPATNIGEDHATLNGSVNPNGASTNAWFEWGTSQSLGNRTNSKSIGSGNNFVSINESLNNLEPDTTYFFRVVAQNQFGTSRGQILSFHTDLRQQNNQAPSVQTQPATNIGEDHATLNGRVNPNGLATNAWFEWGTSQSLGNRTNSRSVGSGNNFQSIEESLNNLEPDTQYFFRVVAQNQAGTSRGQILSFTTDFRQQLNVPVVSTQPATNINQDSATLNGRVNPNGSNTNFWFEWGTSQSLGNRTNSQSIGSGNSSIGVNNSISGLEPDTQYFFRVVAQNQAGTSRGQILSFTTEQDQLGQLPSVTTLSAEDVREFSATLRGRVNPNGRNTSAWFEWGETRSLGNRTNSQSVGSSNGSFNVDEFLNNLEPDTQYFFRVVAQNQFGTARGSILSFTTEPDDFDRRDRPDVETLSATNVSRTSATLRGEVRSSGSNTSVFFEYGPTQSLGFTTGLRSIGSSSIRRDFEATVTGLSLNTRYFFRAGATNSFGTDFGQTLSFVTDSDGRIIDGSAPIVTTLPATFVFANSALLNGTVNPNGANTTAWFEWGETQNLENRTQIQAVGSSNSAQNISFALSGLKPGTRYFFTAVANNGFGEREGQVLSFVTQSSRIIIPRPTVQPEPTVIIQRVIQEVSSGDELITLTPSVDKQNPKAGDTITYTVTYRNLGNKAVKDAVLRTILPAEVEYQICTLSPTNQQSGVVTFNIGTIPGQSQGQVSIQVRIKENVSEGSALVFNSAMDYRDSRNRFQSVNTFLTVVVGEGVSTFGASLSEFFRNLFGTWLVYLLLGLIIGFGIYHFFVKSKESDTVS